MKNIYLRKDGRFEGRFCNQKESKIHYFYGKTKEEVEEKIQSFMESLYYGKSVLTVKMLFEKWIEVIKYRVKESTLANYRGKAETHILPLFGELCTDELTEERTMKFVDNKLKSGLSSNYIADIVILLKSVMKYGAQVHNIKNNISSVVIPKKKKTEILLLNKSQQKRLENYFLKYQSTTSMGIALSMFTGIRLGELCALKWEDVDMEKRTITILKTIQRIPCVRGTKIIITEPKSSSSVRVIPIPDCILSMLKKFLADGKFYLLSGTEKPVEPRTMQYRFKSVLKKANLPSIHFHALRHMFATNCIELGFDVKTLSEILGHSGVEITLNRYVHSSLERKKQFMKRLKFAA